jgi:integrase
MSGKTRRRSAGEGGIVAYRLKNGEQRYAAKFRTDDGRQVLRRRDEDGKPFTRKKDAAEYLQRTLTKVKRGEWSEPSKMPLREWLEQWRRGLRLKPSTLHSYEKNCRLHIAPYLGDFPLKSLTTARINEWLRDLETGGRKDHAEGRPLSPRTVRYCFTILSASLRAAVEQDMLARNPSERANPPSAKQAKPPEMHPWTAEHLRAFLDWSRENDTERHPIWLLLAMTGMRRGEALALRWRDVDFDAGTASVRRSAARVRVDGHERRQIIEGDTKTGTARVVDLDDATVKVLREWRATLAGHALTLARPEALVFPTIGTGEHRHPEHVSRDFQSALTKCATALGDAAPPKIRLHDLRHTHATLLLKDGQPVKVVSERLGHASPTITMTVYAHVLPTMQREAADAFGALILGSKP